MSELSVTIGKRIRNFRTSQKMSQEELAEKCDLHPTYIGQVERGEKNATLESISKIATGLSVSLSTLFENINDTATDGTNFPNEAYELIQSLPPKDQKKILYLIKAAISLKE